MVGEFGEGENRGQPSTRTKQQRHTYFKNDIVDRRTRVHHRRRESAIYRPVWLPVSYRQGMQDATESVQKDVRPSLPANYLPRIGRIDEDT